MRREPRAGKLSVFVKICVTMPLSSIPCRVMLSGSSSASSAQTIEYPMAFTGSEVSNSQVASVSFRVAKVAPFLSKSGKASLPSVLMIVAIVVASAKYVP